MIKNNWLWDVKATEEEVKKILSDAKEPRFLFYAGLLLSRNHDPSYVFTFIDKEIFCWYWPLIRERLDRGGWFSPYKSDYWQPIYETTLNALKKTGKDIPQFPAIAMTKDRFYLALEIRKLRKYAKLNQKDLARRLGVKQQYVSKLETGRVNPSLETLGKIANIFGKRLQIRFG